METEPITFMIEEEEEKITDAEYTLATYALLQKMNVQLTNLDNVVETIKKSVQVTKAFQRPPDTA